MSGFRVKMRHNNHYNIAKNRIAFSEFTRNFMQERKNFSKGIPPVYVSPKRAHVGRDIIANLLLTNVVYSQKVDKE